MSIIKLKQNITFTASRLSIQSDITVPITLIKNNYQVSMQMPPVRFVSSPVVGHDTTQVWTANNIDSQFLPALSYIDKMYFLLPTYNEATSIKYKTGVLVLDCQTGQIRLGQDVTNSDSELYPFLNWNISVVDSKEFGTRNVSSNNTFTWSV